MKETKQAAPRKGARPRRAEIDTEVDPRFEPVIEALAGARGLTGGKMMASYALKVNGKIFAMYGRGRFVTKLPKSRVDALVADSKGERFSTGAGRVMKEWIAMAGEEQEWVALAREAYDFVKGAT